MKCERRWQEALGRDFKEDFLLDTAIDMWLTHSWCQAFPETELIFDKPVYPVTLHGDPARIWVWDFILSGPLSNIIRVG